MNLNLLQNRLHKMIHIIFNPKSGNKKDNFKRKIIQVLEKIPNTYLHLTVKSNHAKELANIAINSQAEKIIVIGGDGTINEVASKMINTQIPLAIIPMGSGNGLARHLSIPLNFKLALNKCLHGEPIDIDVVYFNDKPFFCTAGIGFDAVVAHQFAKSKSRGFFNYVLSTFSSIFNYKNIELTLENNHKISIFSMTIANANQFGNNAYISPHSNLQDGQFEIIRIQPLKLWEMIELGIRLFSKSLNKHSKVTISSNHSFHFNVKIGTPMHLDGENLFIEKELNKIIIKENALKIIR
jgi:diacylglycerol kinase (ATP)